MKSREEKSFAWFPVSLHTFKEKRKKKIDVLNNASLLHNEKLYLSACKQQNRLVFPLLFPSSSWSANEKKSVQKG